MDDKLIKGKDRKISGVCSGLAEYIDVDVTLVRVLYACLTVFSACFPGVILYIILSILLPNE